MMAAFVTVKIDLVAVEEEIRHSAEWRARAQELAARGLAYAQSIAPVETGAYRDSLFSQVQPTSTPGVISGVPAVVVGNTSDHWIEVEFQEPMRYLPLLRTLDYLMGE